jgi:plasmid stabilization system protein ParE
LNFKFTDPAAADLDRLYRFLEPVNPSAAARAILTITQAVRRLDQFPNRGRPAPDGARELIVPFGSSEYIVRYRYVAANDQVTVFRVWHRRENRN